MRDIKELRSWVAEDKRRLETYRGWLVRMPGDELTLESIQAAEASLAKNQAKLDVMEHELVLALAAPVLPPKTLITMLSTLPGTACTPPVPQGTQGRVVGPAPQDVAPGKTHVKFKGKDLGYMDGEPVELYIPNHLLG